MPVIPRYQTQVQQSGFDAYRAARLTPQVPAGGLGGSRAQDLGQLAGGIMQAAQTAGGIMVQQQNEINQVKVRSALTQARLESSGMTTAFLNREGMDAMDVRKQAGKQFTDLKSRYLEQFDNDVQKRMFGMLFDEQTASNLERLGTHQAAEVKKATLATRASETKMFMSEIPIHVFDQEALDELMRGIKQNASASFGKYGKSVLDDETFKLTTEFHNTAINELAQHDLQAAHKYYSENKSEILPEVSTKIAGMFDSQLPKDTGHRAAEEIFSRTGHRKYHEALKELAGMKMGKEDREHARDRLMQLNRAGLAEANARDESELNAFFSSQAFSEMTPAQQDLAVLGMNLEYPTQENVLKSLGMGRERDADAKGEAFFMEFYDGADQRPDLFKEMNLSQWRPILGNERYMQLVSLQKRVREGSRSEEDKIISEGLKAWDVVNPVPKDKAFWTGERDEPSIIRHMGQRHAVRRDLLKGVDELRRTDMLENQAARQSLLMSVFDTRIEVQQFDEVMPFGEGFVTPVKVGDPQEEIANTKAFRARFESAGGYAWGRWTYEQDKGRLVTTDTKEIAQVLTNYPNIVPKGEEIESVMVDTFGRPTRAVFKSGKVWTRRPTGAGQ